MDEKLTIVKYTLDLESWELQANLRYETTLNETHKS